MANYYTTRFHPSRWPPHEGVPPGVELSSTELSAEGHLCCDEARLLSVQSEAGPKDWEYETRYRLECSHHGERSLTLLSTLDWISPNEYLLDRSESR